MMAVKEHEHVWNLLKKHQITSDESIDFFEGGLEEKANILRHLEPNEYLVVDTLPVDEANTTPFQNYIKSLRKCGIDVGKGNTEYGFKMPLPKNGDPYRELRIFRRRK